MGRSGIYRTGNRLGGGFICGPAYDVPKRRCACGVSGNALFLCDGPRSMRREPMVDDEHDESLLCSIPLCSDCTIALRVFDLDYCRDCAGAPTVGACHLRALGPTTSPLSRCSGVLVPKAALCVRHAVLFDHWHAFEGGEAIYSDPAFTREQRRDKHRLWLRTAGDHEIARILTERRALAPPKP